MTLGILINCIILIIPFSSPVIKSSQFLIGEHETTYETFVCHAAPAVGNATTDVPMDE